MLVEGFWMAHFLCGCGKQKQGKHVKFVREIVREIAGMSPLERRAVELLKNGRDKRVLKLCKKRVSLPLHAPRTRFSAVACFKRRSERFKCDVI